MIVGKDGVIARTGDMEARAAADRVHRLLEEAKEHGHYVNGWYAYIDRRDVERMIEALR